MELIRPWYARQAVFDGRVFFVADLQAERLHAEGWTLERVRAFMRGHELLSREESHATCFYAGRGVLDPAWRLHSGPWEAQVLSGRLSLEQAEALFHVWQEET